MTVTRILAPVGGVLAFGVGYTLLGFGLLLVLPGFILVHWAKGLKNRYHHVGPRVRR